MVYEILRKTLMPLIKTIFIKNISGLENLPKNEPYIIAANHSSYIDPVLLGVVLTTHLNKQINFIAMKPLAKHWYSRLIIGKYFKTIFVNGSVKEAINKIKNKGIIVIFPEGRRTTNGELQNIEGTGTAVIANITKTKVIPTAIDGTFELWPKQQLLPHFKKIVSIRFGTKKLFKTNNPTKKQMKQFIKVIMKQIATLCNKRYYH